MTRTDEIKELLISNAIHLIAEGGFEMATTKELTHRGGGLPGFKMNEVYIYRIFGSKETLYAAAFQRLNDELYYAFLGGVNDVGPFEGDVKEKLYTFFLKSWSFILGNEESCRCYVRYYYSIYMKGASLDSYNEHFERIIAEFRHLFTEDADVSAIMHSVFNALFNFAIRVHNGDLEDSEINRPHIFNVLYCMMAAYFKDSVKAS